MSFTARLIHYRTNTWRRAWIFTNEDGSAYDLSGATARLHLRDADR